MISLIILPMHLIHCLLLKYIGHWVHLDIRNKAITEYISQQVFYHLDL